MTLSKILQSQHAAKLFRQHETDLFDANFVIMEYVTEARRIVLIA